MTAPEGRLPNTGQLKRSDWKAEKALTDLCLKHHANGCLNGEAFNFFPLSSFTNPSGSRNAVKPTDIEKVARTYTGALLSSKVFMKEWVSFKTRHKEAILMTGYPLTIRKPAWVQEKKIEYFINTLEDFKGQAGNLNNAQIDFCTALEMFVNKPIARDDKIEALHSDFNTFARKHCITHMVYDGITSSNITSSSKSCF